MEKQKERNVNYSNEEAGITLIALVITIIVLLILASVSLSLVVGENGILSKATSAATQSKKSQLEEEVQLLLADWQADYLTNGTSYEGRSETTSSGAVVTCIGDSILVSNGAETYIASFNNGQVGELIKQELGEDSQAYKAMHPKVPTGFTHITGEWNTGYVIQETSTGDEFVWIPVVSEASYAKKSGSKNRSMSSETHDDGMNYTDVLQFIKGDNLGVTNILGTAITEEIIGKDKIGSTTGEKITRYNIPEKEIVCNVGGFYISRYEIGIANRIPEGATKVESAQNESNWTTIYSKIGLEPVRNIAHAKALELANSWKKGNDYQSGLVTGTQWDVLCNFIGWSKCDSACSDWGNHCNNPSSEFTSLYTSGNEPTWHSNPDKDPAHQWFAQLDTWKRNDVSEKKRCVFPTGIFKNSLGESSVEKNIYDIVGNVTSLTTEISMYDGESYHVSRSTSAYSLGSDGATYRDGAVSASWASPYAGFRAVLYVK